MCWYKEFTDGEVRWIDSWVNADDLLQQSGYRAEGVPQHRRQVWNYFPLLTTTSELMHHRLIFQQSTDSMFYTDIIKESTQRVQTSVNCQQICFSSQ